ncbi:restriction endonuclease subunit S [Flavobacterium sp. WC2509]|uniref:restriction endonuclease subunit S n=1 Tax=Flavobacterium sp. WC2509 TaxID=3461406 RepID=UPI004044839C
MSRISKTTLGNLVEFQRGYDLPKSQFQEGTIPVISSNGILGYHNQSKVKGPGITIGRSGTVGLPHFIKENFFPHNTALFIKDFKGNNPRYIYYLIKTLGLNDYKSGSGVPTMNRNHLHPIEVRAFLENEDQQKIAKVLSDLDAKIELNNKINTELEAMAKTLYDYWFVQFDFPDNNGKPYKTSGGKMVWNEELKREIPEGWEIKKISEVSTIKAGGDKPKIYSNEKSKTYSIPIYSNGITNDGLYGYTNEAKIHKQSITISARGTIGFCVLRNHPFVPIIRLIVIIPNESCSTKYLFETIKNIPFEKSGSVQQQLTAPQVSQIDVLYPATNLLNKFDQITSSYINKIELIKEENQELASLRDWLLPMLMNGQVTVGDLEEELGMVAEPAQIYEKTEKKIIEKVKKAKTTAIKLNPVDVYKRTLLAAEIVFQLKDTYTLGHLKLQKMLFLCQELENMALPMNFLKQAMGPYDNQLARSLDKQFVTKKWFIYQKAEALKFKPLENCGKHKDDFNKYFEDQLEGINYIIKKFTIFTSTQIEAVATLYACWKETIENNELINDKLIITKFYNWSKEKEKFKEENLVKALAWMRKNGIEPKTKLNE